MPMGRSRAVNNRKSTKYRKDSVSTGNTILPNRYLFRKWNEELRKYFFFYQEKEECCSRDDDTTSINTIPIRTHGDISQTSQLQVADEVKFFHPKKNKVTSGYYLGVNPYTGLHIVAFWSGVAMSEQFELVLREEQHSRKNPLSKGEFSQWATKKTQKKDMRYTKQLRARNRVREALINEHFGSLDAALLKFHRNFIGAVISNVRLPYSMFQNARF